MKCFRVVLLLPTFCLQKMCPSRFLCAKTFCCYCQCADAQCLLLFKIYCGNEGVYNYYNQLKYIEINHYDLTCICLCELLKKSDIKKINSLAAKMSFCGLSVSSLHVLPGSACVPSGFYGFLPQSKDMYMRQFRVQIVSRCECVWFYVFQCCFVVNW